MTGDAKPQNEKTKIPKRTETWAEDQQNRSYYYDDATGYEKYDPEDDESDESDDKDEEAPIRSA